MGDLVEQVRDQLDLAGNQVELPRDRVELIRDLLEGVAKLVKHVVLSATLRQHFQEGPSAQPPPPATALRMPRSCRQAKNRATFHPPCPTLPVPMPRNPCGLEWRNDVRWKLLLCDKEMER